MKRLNFGCGNEIKKDWINVDIQKRKGVNKSFDFTKFPYPFKKDTFNYVLIDNVLEHLFNPKKTMEELWRICKSGAIIEIIVPYYNSYYAYADSTHVNFFNEVGIRQTILNSPYEDSKNKEKFDIIELKSIPQRYLRFLPSKLLSVLKRFFGNVIVELRVKAKVINK